MATNEGIGSGPVDNRLQLGYGSAWHLLRCLGWRRAEFSAVIANKLHATQVDWLDFPGPRTSSSYSSKVPIRDGEWRRLDFIPRDAVHEAFKDYWPTRGEQQNWDAIGKAKINGVDEWILIEAKGHVNEISFSGTGAQEHGGRPMIRSAFQATLRELGYDDSESKIRAETWLTRCYQYANRLATLHFLNSRQIPARLVFLYFCGDRHPSGLVGPRNESEWEGTLKSVREVLGWKGMSELEKRVSNVFFNVDR